MKQWYESKTLWVNAIALVAMLIQSFTGFVISANDQIAILAVINIILRAVTGEDVYFGSKNFKK